MSKVSLVYLGGWALVLGLMLVGIAAASGGSDSVGFRNSGFSAAVFESIAHEPGEFIQAAVSVWVVYTIPFIPFWLSLRKRRKNI